MAEDTIRVGFVGAGANTGLRHIPGLRAQPGVELAGVANRSLASSQRVCDEYEIPKAYEDWVELIDDDDIDAVCIGTWPYMHRTLTLAALEAGKHVLCEARMAMDSNEAHEMLDASNANPDLVTQIVPPPPALSWRTRRTWGVIHMPDVSRVAKGPTLPRGRRDGFSYGGRARACSAATWRRRTPRRLGDC